MAEALRSQLLGLRAEALRELHNETAQLPPSRRRRRAAKLCPTRLNTLGPPLIREYARLFRIEYLQACDELFPALAADNVHQPVRREDLKPSPLTGREVLTAYYSDDSLAQGGLAPYEVEINDRRVRLALATRATWSSLSIPFAVLGGSSPHERCGLATTAVPDRAIDHFHSSALRFLCDIEAKGLEIYDSPIFRLRDLDVRGGGLAATFSLDSFLHYRLSVGLLADELTRALAQADSIVDLPSVSDRMPLRTQILPDGAGLADFDNRVCSGGVLTLLAIARPKPHNDFVVLAQRRSAAVSDSPGLLSVIPTAFHQPSVLPHFRAMASDVAPSATMYRELFEEVLGGREVELADQDLESMWFVEESKPLRWLRERPDSYLAHCVGLGINLLSGNYEIGTMLVIHDPRFWRAFERVLRPNWEVANLIRCSTRPGAGAHPRRGLSGLIRATDQWTSEALMVLVEGLASSSGNSRRGCAFPRYVPVASRQHRPS